MVLNLGCLIRITWEASTHQSKSSGCIPRILSSCFQGWCPGQQQKIPMWRQDCKPTTALEVLLSDKLSSPRGWNARHCRELMIKVCLPKCTTFCLYKIWKFQIEQAEASWGNSTPQIQPFKSCGWRDGPSPPSQLRLGIQQNLMDK